MSTWPLISDFSRLLQRPQLAFRDPVLKECTVEVDNFGQPKPRSGNFATVYRGYGKDNRSFAIRVFNRRQDERLTHYQAISHYLENLRVHGLVGFEYDERGIRSASDGKMYPLLTMEWVPGVTLFDWCRDRCREDYKEALAIGAEAWLQLVRAMRRNGIVHGDLQHGNILVSEEGHFKLVDYDCMCVPELLGIRNPEIGLEPYQHPGRNAETKMFAGLDNYSALLIYVVLKSLSVAPWLWTKYVDEPGYDKMLFRKEDFQNPQQSPLYNELLSLPDQQVRNLVHYLFELRKYPLEDVPDIDEVLLWCLSLEELLAARDFDTAVALMDRMSEEEQVPPHLAQQAADAQRRVQCRKALEEAIRRGDESEIMRYYVPELLDDYPSAEPLVQQAKVAAHVAPVLEALGTSMKFHKWDTFRSLWNANHALLAHRPSARLYKTEMKRLLAADAVGKLLGDSKSSDESIVRAWQYLASLGGHATAEPYKPRVESLIERHRALPILKKLISTAPEKPTMAHDSKLVNAWRPEFGDWPAAASYRAACEAAKIRLRQIEKIRNLAKSTTLENEKAIYKLSRALPDDYHPLMHDRVRQTRHRLKAFQVLQKAITPPRSDLTIAKAWRDMKKHGGKQLVSEKIAQRADLAERRAELIEKLQQRQAHANADVRDRELLALWDEQLLEGCFDVDPVRPMYEVAKRRRLVLDRLRQAIEDRDAGAARRLLADRLMQDYPLSDELQAGIQAVEEHASQQRLAARQRMIAALLGNRKTEFVRTFDHTLLREICEQFKHHQPVISQWTETEILPLRSIGLSLDLPAQAAAEQPAADDSHGNGHAEPPPAERGGVAWQEDGKVSIRWRWPEPRFGNSCRLLVTRQTPKSHTHPDDVESLYDTTITRDQWLEHDSRFTITPQEEWLGANVIVWSVVELGYQTFHSEPLVVGQLTAPKQAKKRWGIFG